MKTVKTVGDGNEKMGDDQLGVLTRRFDEIKRRINQGTIGHGWVMNQLQTEVIEAGCFSRPRNWKVWRTIVTGKYRDVEDLLSSVEKSSKISFLQGGPSPLSGLVLNAKPQRIELVKVNLWDLFPKDEALLGDIVSMAQMCDLKIMTVEEALLLRLDYQDQPEKSRVHVEIPLIRKNKGCSFSIGNRFNSATGFDFSCHDLSLDCLWSIKDNSPWIFVLNRMDV